MAIANPNFFEQPFQTYAPEDYRYTQTAPMPGAQTQTGGGGGDWWSQNSPTPVQPNPGDGPQGNPLRPGMSAQEFRQALDQFAQSRGYGPVSDSSFNTWYGYYNDYGQRDPNYLWMRLSDTGEFGGRDTYGAGGGGGGGGNLSIESLMQDPGYQARLREGEQGIQRSAAARGTLLTGGLQKALERYRQDYASNEFQNAFNRNLSLAGLGQFGASGQAGAYGNMGGAAGAYGPFMGGYLTNQGNVQAAGTVGSGNAWQGTLGQLGNLAAYYAMQRGGQ